MDAARDTRALIRNVLPGLAFVLELLAFSMMFGLLDMQDVENAWKTFSSKDSSAIVIGAVTVFLGSGAVGYLLAHLHHTIANMIRPCVRQWLWDWAPLRGVIELWPACDFSPAIRRLIADGHLRVFVQNGNEAQFQRPEPARDWVVVNSLWHERRETNQQVKAATARGESLTDIAHGAGTLFVGSLLAYMIAFVLTLLVVSPVSWWGLAGLVFVFFHWMSFRWTVRATEGFIGTVLQNQVRYDALKDGSPVLVFYAGDAAQ